MWDRRHSLFLFVLLVVVNSTLRPTTQIEQAFQQDGFKVTQWVQYQGMRGCIAESTHATVLGTGLPKRVYYAEGSHYQMGYLIGMLTPNETAMMAIDYIDRMVPSLISSSFTQKFENSTLFNKLIDILADFLIVGSNESFDKLYAAKTVFPEYLIDEIRGVLAGVLSVNASSPVTLPRLITLNYGFDWLSAWAFAGVSETESSVTLSAHLQGIAKRKHWGDDSELMAVLDETVTSGLLQFPFNCDAFGARYPATVDSSTFLFARDFQLPTCDVFQNINAVFLFNPTDGTYPLLSVSAPGLIGSITSMNMHGLAMGVDTLRSAFGNTSWPGLNSILLVRHTAHSANTSQAALSTIADAQRGCPWLYPLCSGLDGECYMVESGAYTPGPASEFDPLRFVRSHALEGLLPNASFVRQYNSDSAWMNGMYARGFDYVHPDAFLAFNEALFEHAHWAYNSSAWGVDGYVFQHWREEKIGEVLLSNAYFTPLRQAVAAPKADTDRDFVVVSNVAIVPEMRLAQMGPLSNLFAKAADCAQWRYDSLIDALNQQHGTLDIDTAKDIITFLSPDRTPGYWHDEFIPGKPMSAQIEGAIAVCSLQVSDANPPTHSIEMHVKTGYWSDEWTHVTLLNYV